MEQLSRLSVFFIGLGVGLAVSAAWFLGDTEHLLPDTDRSEASETASSSPVLTTTDAGAVSVMDQKAGDTVTVASVTVPPPGVWVAVREVTGDTLGNVLGAVRVHGPLSNVEVPLLRATVPGQVYAVTLYRDDGSPEFDPTQSSVYVDFDTGERVTALFKTLP